MNIIGSYSYKDADVLRGIIPITNEIDAAVIHLYPPGSIKKMYKNKDSFLKTMDDIKGDILEISTNVKYDYKELGEGSKWGDITKKGYVKLHSAKEKDEDIPSNISCKYVLFSSPKLIIDFNNITVYNYFKSRFNGITINKEKVVKLFVAQQYLPFRIVYMNPEGTTIINDNTIISFIFPLSFSGKEITIQTYPVLPDEYADDLKSKQPTFGCTFDVIS